MAGDTYVVDIETVGQPWASLDERTREYLLGRAANDAEREGVTRRLGLSPGTGRIIVIAMLNVTNAATGGVFVEARPERAPGTEARPDARKDSPRWVEGGPQGFKRFEGDEREMLAEFWHLVERAGRIVTFNGREFDGPFLMLRSAILGVRPSLNLAGYRYSVERHCDLAEVLSFHGASRERFSLDYWCRRFGITSPKDEGLTGSEVQGAYEAGRIEDIARYCVRDVVATAALHAALKDTLLPLFLRGR